MSHSQPAIERHPPAAFALLKLLRPWQWVKNLLVFAPLLFAHQLSDSALIMQGIFAFISLSFVASAVYVINDWADVEQIAYIQLRNVARSPAVPYPEKRVGPSPLHYWVWASD